MKWGRSRVGVLVVLVLLSASGCSTPDQVRRTTHPSTAPPGLAGDDGSVGRLSDDHWGWRRLDLEGEATALGGDWEVAVAAGSSPRGPWARYLGREATRQVDPGFLAGIERPDGLTEHAGFMAVVGDDGLGVVRAGGALVDVGEGEPSVLDVPTDQAGRAPEWLKLQFGGEETLYAVGLVAGDRTDGAPRLVAWTDTGRWTQVRGRLYAAPRMTPLAEATETGVVVAGHLTSVPPGPGAAPSPLALWSAPDASAPRGRWTNEPLRPAPDTISDLRCWDLGCWVTGVREGRALLLDHDLPEGGRVPTPPVELPSGATVLIAREPIGGGVVLAVETQDGNELWVRQRADLSETSGWRRLRAPDGDIVAARSSRGTVHLLLDHTIWHARITDLAAAA